MTTDARVRQPIDSGALRQVVDELVTAGAPGAAVRVEDEYGIRQAASGLADIRTRRPMQPHLRFRAGSVAKPFVAGLVLQLHAGGKLSLSDTVERWLPGILPYGAEITIRQLLNHTSGIPNYSTSLWRALYGASGARFRSWAPRELVALVADQPAAFAPGRVWSYSNAGYVLAGLIVEAATRSTLGAELSRRIFEPLGLRHTSFPLNATGIPGPSSRGYSPPLSAELDILDGPLLDFTDQNPSYAWAAGALVSNLEDLARFLRALLGGRLFPAELRADMLTTVPVPPESLPLPLYARYGLGVVEVDTPAGSLVGGPGGIPGFLNMVLSTRDGRRQLGVMINVGDRAPGPVVEAFMHALREFGTRLLA
jgi:D-alanyl-D-alanine carboxypeptidase